MARSNRYMSEDWLIHRNIATTQDTCTVRTRADLDWFAARLSIAVYDTNAEYRMGIYELKQQLRHLQGINDLTMRYGKGDAQIFRMGEIEAEVRPMATTAEIEAA